VLFGAYANRPPEQRQSRIKTMRAEAQAYADSIKQALDLLRRFL
jgi:hypothetical protein